LEEVVADKFRMSTNGGQAYTAEDIVKEGTYNLFITPHQLSNVETK
jgi:hypothetical protein